VALVDVGAVFSSMFVPPFVVVLLVESVTDNVGLKFSLFINRMYYIIILLLTYLKFVK
jgi:hypothetical protein